MDAEDRFWSMIEVAWARLGAEAVMDRTALIRRIPDPDDDPDYSAVEQWLDPLLDLLRSDCDTVSDEGLTDLDQVVARKLEELNRPEIHEVVEGSYDGFLYRRGFIVALGREFHTAVLADPEAAVYDAECAELCFLFGQVLDQRRAGL